MDSHATSDLASVIDPSAQIVALNKYLATPQMLTSASTDTASGTVVHIPHIGSFSLPSAAGPLAVVAGVFFSF